MLLTEEQLEIINSTGNIRINAVAGSGKTTTVIEYAKTRPKTAKILYLAFNKSVKLEAIKKFYDNGLTNVKVETAHSLAYRHIVHDYGYNINPNGYKTYEIAELLGLKGEGEKHAKYIIANHINKFLTYFCNSNAEKVNQLNYADVVFEPKAKTFVTKFYDYIEYQTRLLLGKMNKGSIDIIHDFYLKKFQLSKPNLNFDYILFDEGQDASAAMLDIFLRQNCIKVIVGDTHQQIYGWRYAVNSLEKVDFKDYYLSSSFRFDTNIAALATDILDWKSFMEGFKPVRILGLGKNKNEKSKVVIARTNLGLLVKAIEYVTSGKDVKNLYFEGNINSYTYADDGASLYDVLNLQNNNRAFIKDKLILEMKNMKELEEYIENTEDVQLGMMVDIVKEYGNEIPAIIKQIKSKHIGNDEKQNAEMIFSTVHRCKGMEYDVVRLANDFINEKRIEKILDEAQEVEVNYSKINEEINLLYVAVTRTANKVYIPSEIIPESTYNPKNIIIEAAKTKKSTAYEPKYYDDEDFKKDFYPVTKLSKKTMRKSRTPAQTFPNSGNPWSLTDDYELKKMFWNNESISDMAVHFERSEKAVIRRISKLKLNDIYGENV